MFVYLDNSSTTRPYDRTLKIMMKVLGEDFGNPSSLHSLGVAAKSMSKTPEDLWQEFSAYLKRRYISLPAALNQTMRRS